MFSIGFAWTMMNRPLLEDPASCRAFVAQIPLGRWGELEEIGGLALFLAGDLPKSSQLSGGCNTVRS